PAVRDAPRVLVDDLAERRPHRELVRAGTDHVAGDAVELRPGALFRPDAAEPVGSAQHDPRHAGERLDVVDDRRAAEDAVHGRDRRLDARVGAFPLERLDEPRLLAADVRAGATVHPHVEVEARAENVLPEEAAWRASSIAASIRWQASSISPR